MRKYLFICGTPRSGTSALVILIGAHSKLALGIERFKYYLNKPNREKWLGTYLFTKSRFFDFSDGATNVKPNENNFYTNYYASLEEKYNQT